MAWYGCGGAPNFGKLTHPKKRKKKGIRLPGHMETPLNSHYTYVCVKADPEIKPIKVAVESQS
jgi:hypothetical protein